MRVQQQNSGAVEDFILPYSAVIYKSKSERIIEIVKVKVAPFYGPRCILLRKLLTAF